jgi:hypothetical protein
MGFKKMKKPIKVVVVIIITTTATTISLQLIIDFFSYAKPGQIIIIIIKYITLSSFPAILAYGQIPRNYD